MKKLLLPLLILLSFGKTYSQQWFVTRVADAPMSISNNAVVEGWANDTGYVYSFGGIDSTKIWSGITKKSFRYNTVTDVWDTIPDLPNTNAVIASGASYVDSIIYIMGGYQVLSNGSEISSNIVNRFDPRTNTYLSDGANIPVAIDDHVQVVWNDSLIYLITGWSNTTNVPNVQIYDPTNDNWLTGTSVPNNNTYKVFGASGGILDNQIVYHGGASTGINFPAQSNLRIGQINPSNPTQITWSVYSQNPNYKTYRSACAVVTQAWVPTMNWLGGSDVSYNYNGIAYNGSGGVEPQNRNLWTGGAGGPLDSFQVFGATLPMDLRGIAGPFGILDSDFYIVGGMETNQQVSKKTLLLQHTGIFSIDENEMNKFNLFPNPALEQVNLVFEEIEKRTIRLFDILGNEVFKAESDQLSHQLDVTQYSKGIYLIKVQTDKGSSSQKIVVQ